jgi:hypothetical protein
MNLISFNKRHATKSIFLSILVLYNVCDALKYKKGDEVTIMIIIYTF